MALNDSSSLLFLLLTFLSVSLPGVAPSTPVKTTAACNSTTDPAFCNSVLPPSASSSIYDYGRLSIRRSLYLSRRFSKMVNGYLRNRSSLTKGAVMVLEDCKLLTELNIDFLTTAASRVNSTDSLAALQADEVQTLLSAIITNQQTCLDGIQVTASAWRVWNDLAVPLGNGTRLFRVSLGLFNHAWRHGKTKKRGLFESPFQLNNVAVRETVVVAQDGTGNFTAIQDAVAAAPNGTDVGDGYFVIFIRAGRYEEYVSVGKNKKNIMMVGEGINRTVITGNRSVGDGWTTFNSATLAVVGERFVGVNLTVCNTAGPEKHQAVAVRNGADLSAFYSCSFEGYQDTLYTHSLRQFYRACDVYGTVDFIFGNAAVVFQSCNLYARQPMAGQNNVLTAQGRTDPNQNTGISILGCTIAAAADLRPANGSSATKTYLGRPWKEYSRTVYLQSFMDGLIEPSGWLPWNGDFALATLYYAEFNNTGLGAGTGLRVKWAGYHVIDAADAANFTVSGFIQGDSWLTAAGVPFISSLL